MRPNVCVGLIVFRVCFNISTETPTAICWHKSQHNYIVVRNTETFKTRGICCDQQFLGFKAVSPLVFWCSGLLFAVCSVAGSLVLYFLFFLQLWRRSINFLGCWCSNYFCTAFDRIVIQNLITDMQWSTAVVNKRNKYNMEKIRVGTPRSLLRLRLNMFSAKQDLCQYFWADNRLCQTCIRHSPRFCKVF